MGITSQTTAPKTTGIAFGGGATGYVPCITMKNLECGCNPHATTLILSGVRTRGCAGGLRKEEKNYD